MTVSRTMPYFYSPQAAMGGLKSDKPVRWYQVAISLLIMYFFFSACLHLLVSTATIFDFIIMGIMVIWGLLSIGQDSPEVKEAKQKWKDTSAFADVAILSRDYRPGGSYQDEYEIPHTVRPRYSLTLELPGQADVKADISESVYKRLENRDTVRIYYKPEEPLRFVLEEEL